MQAMIRSAPPQAKQVSMSMRLKKNLSPFLVPFFCLPLLGGSGFGAPPPLRRCHRCSLLAVRGKYPMEVRQIDPGFWHQGGEPGDEIERLEDDMRGAVTVRRLELGRSCASLRPRHLYIHLRRSGRCRLT